MEIHTTGRKWIIRTWKKGPAAGQNRSTAEPRPGLPQSSVTDGGKELLRLGLRTQADVRARLAPDEPAMNPLLHFPKSRFVPMIEVVRILTPRAIRRVSVFLGL